MKKFVRGLVVITLLLSCVLAAAAAPATVTLPNGAALQVTVNTPVDGTEFRADGDTRDVAVSGTASVGIGDPDATLIYVMDVSGTTGYGSGTGCAPVLDCEQEFIKALNTAAIRSGSVDEVGTAVFASSAAAADMNPDTGDQPLVTPGADSYVPTVIDSTFAQDGGDGGVNQYTLKTVGYQTYCTEALERAHEISLSSSNSHTIVVMVSDGLCDDNGGGGWGAFNGAIESLKNDGVIVNTVAAGAGSSCNAYESSDFKATLQMIADGTGGKCFQVPDPGLLPDIIPDLVSTTLDSLELEVDGGGKVTIPNSEIDPDLPHAGAVSVDYAVTVPGLAPGDHTIEVTATGHDNAGDDSVTESVTIHVFDLSLAPASRTNELGTPGQTHTVTATIEGADIDGRTVSFDVYAGPNTGKTGTCSTDGSGSCSFTYTALQGPGGLGTDRIRARVTLKAPPGETMTAEGTKKWADTTPPAGACSAGPNPSGNVPKAKGGQRPDGFYALTATDSVDPSPSVFLVDRGSGTIFGPFPSGTNIKYTQAPGATPGKKSMSGVVSWHITGTGDAAVYAKDASGNTQKSPVSCLVPPPPK